LRVTFTNGKEIDMNLRYILLHKVSNVQKMHIANSVYQLTTLNAIFENN